MNDENVLEKKSIVVGVTGGIACYKTVDLVSELSKFGTEIITLMTDAATEFVSPLTFRSISGNSVYVKLFDENGKSEINHVELSRKADLFAIVPTTLNTIGKLANGLSDNLLTTTLHATTKPVLICPSMDHQMYESTANQVNLTTLSNRGYFILEPEKGRLASGRKGRGRLPSTEKIKKELVSILEEGNLLQGKKILVTAGPTVEPIDPLRWISNRSSGKMGYALAQEAKRLGGDVLLVSGPTELTPPAGVGVIRIETASQLEEMVEKEFDKQDLVLMAAAVADWRPEKEETNKIKKSNMNQLNLELKPNPDILKKMGKMKRKNQVLVGFAAETEHVEENAKKKLKDKNLNAIFANPVGKNELGPGRELNEGTLILKSGTSIPFPTQNKSSLARSILRELAERFYEKKQ